MDKPGEKDQVSMKVLDEKLIPQYANVVQVFCNDQEFFIDFMLLTQPTGVMVSRLVVSPQHFEQIIKAFQDNLKQFKDRKVNDFKNGKI